MATIGTFKKSGTELQGEIVTLSVQTKNVRIVPEPNRASENAPKRLERLLQHRRVPPVSGKCLDPGIPVR
jgi:uncharacterized protein (DUF736 family)